MLEAAVKSIATHDDEPVEVREHALSHAQDVMVDAYKQIRIRALNQAEHKVAALQTALQPKA